ncbi:hypothetical protein BURKHO8Y_450015 [Burkholderia sp. 8Y]|nr:hypothetical protein BURKHO8Y_450015 [Burkholderia sp. 8Y]
MPVPLDASSGLLCLPRGTRLAHGDVVTYSLGQTPTCSEIDDVTPQAVLESSKTRRTHYCVRSTLITDSVLNPSRPRPIAMVYQQTHSRRFGQSTRALEVNGAFIQLQVRRPVAQGRPGATSVTDAYAQGRACAFSSASKTGEPCKVHS